MDLDKIFTYHAPTGNDLENYRAIRDAGKELARTIIECTPRCADQNVALRKVREAVMTANASIALRGEV